MDVDNIVPAGPGDGETSEDDVFDDDQGKKIEHLLDSDEDDSSKTGKNKAKSRGTKRDPLGVKVFDLGQSYKTIQAARRSASSLRHLNPALTGTGLVSTGSLLQEGDDRIKCTNIEHDLRSRVSKSLSFDPVGKNCNTCLAGAHSALTGRERWPNCLCGHGPVFSGLCAGQDGG
jgi:hypothetical protein